MADHLILSLQARPFFIFPCSFHRSWRFTGGIKFSDPQFRLSPQLQLVNSTSPSQSSSSSSSSFPPSNSAPEKFDLVSCTQLKDGSHVFRFGDASETEKYLETEEKARCLQVEKKQRAKIAEEAKDLDRVSEKEERSAPSNLSNVIKIKDRKRPRAPTKKKKETSTSVKIASVSNPSSIVSVEDAIPTIPTEEKVVVSEKSDPVNENEITVESYNVEPLSSQVMEKVSVNKIGSRETNGYQQSTENRMEVQARPRPSTSLHGSQLHDLEEVAPVSTIEIDDNLDVREKPEKTIEAEENRMEVQARPRSSTSQNGSQLHDIEEVAPVSTIEIDDNLDVREKPVKTIEAEENRMEVQARPRSSTSQHGSQSHDLEEVAPVSTIEIDDNLDVREKPVKTIEAEENLVVEPTATAAVSPDELISTSEATHHSVDEIAEKPVPDTSEENPMKNFEAEENILVEPKATHRSVDEITEKPVADTSEESPMETFEAEENILVKPEATHRSVDEITEKLVTDTSEVGNERENAASTIEDETTLRDTKTDNGSISKSVNDTKGEDFQLPAPETATLESIEVASGREELVSKSFYLESGFASLQSPSKALAGREDAYFIHHHNWIGIADGVSQWSFEGINKGMYSQELMSNCQKIISDETAKITDPVEVLHRSVNETKSSGSSTALIAHLDNNELHIANIGDSGFIVMRDGTVLQKSSPMFHHFCFPLQIKQGDDVLKLAEVYHVNLEEGDVVITATDGLFDNLYEKEIVSIVCRSLEQSLEPQKIAELVAAKAQEVGGSGRERTPFADAAKEEGYGGYRGGKLDAVTVIISFVKTVST